MLAALSSRILHSSFQEPLGFDLPPAVVTPTVPPEQAPAKAKRGSPRELSFGLLSAICKPKLVDRVLADSGRLEQRCRLLPARLMVYALLLMCLSADLSYQKLMHHLGESGLPGSWSPPHRTAFFRARIRLGWEVMERLFRVLARPLADARCDHCCFWRGRRVVAIDGTTIELQPTPELERAFGGPISNDNKRTGLPQARMVTLIECGTRALLDAVLDHYTQGENTLAARLVRSITPGMLLLADRGFPSRQLWTLFTNAGADLVWRAKGSIAKRVIKHLPDGSYLAHFGKGRAVTVRVVEYKLEGSAQIYRLLTNMLDPRLAPALELAAIYAERWEIEILLKEIKACQCGSRPLRSQTELGVRQEFWAHGVLHQVSRQLAYQAAITITERDPDRISFSLVQDAILRSTAWPRWLIARRLKAVIHHVIRVLTTTKALIDRSDRVCPRVVRRKWSKYRLRKHNPSPGSTRRQRRPGIILCAA